MVHGRPIPDSEQRDPAAVRRVRPTIVFHPAALKHDTGFQHVECANRLVAIRDHLEAVHLWGRDNVVSSRPASVKDLCRVHRREFVQWVKDAARSGAGWAGRDTVIARHSYDAARYAAGAGLAAADLIMGEGARRAFCCVRPPGHHATASVAQGFCLFNNVAVAARYLQHRYGLRRIAIVDWDVHHGNGTQEVFYDDPGVYYFSMHRYPLYPGTGGTAEMGVGRGAGYTFNIPLPFNTTAEEYLARFRRSVHRIAEEYRPEFVIISAGFDSHRADPIGGLGLEAAQYREMTRHLVLETEASAEGRVLSMLEGGYDLATLGECVEQHLEGMMEA